MSALALCTACGLCCDGTLFGQVRLAPDECDAAAVAGLEVVPGPEGDGFLQPCPQLGADRCCAIYTDRPGACRRFRCTTLIALEAGQIDFGSARKRVESAQAAVARLRRRVDGEPSVPAIRRALGTVGIAGDPAWLVALAALDLILDRHFRRADRQVFNPGQAATTASP